MHFVKKVPTSEEEKASKEKERAVKVKIFCQLRDKIFIKRANKELDEEILNLCEAILAKSPDIYTLWNIRRETLDHLKTTNDEEKMDQLYRNELGLTEQCIKANSKSYTAWYQRSWILNRQRKPDLMKELTLCEQALKMDCRNFHCWDHRRIVAKMAELTSEEELKFSQKLVAENFSNFSAWHIRMSLIPRFEEEKETKEKLMKEEDANEEIKRIANAIFTDPNDESAWTYARWLIHLYSPTSFLSDESSCPIIPLSATINGNLLLVVFTRPLSLQSALSFFKSIPEESKWRPVSLFSTQVSRVWECSFEGNPSIEFSSNGTIFRKLECTYVRDALYDRILLGGNVAVIDKIRDHCKELLEEEEDNTMALATLTECLRLTSPIDSHKEIIANLEILGSTIDPLRVNMYKSFASFERLRYGLMTKKEGDIQTRYGILKLGEGRLSLTNMQLTELSNIDLFSPFITELDLRGNDLKEGREIALLPLISSLSIDENPIKSLPDLSSLSRLEFISSASTSLTDPQSVASTLKDCPSVKRFLYCQTPLVDKTDELRHMMGDGIRLFPHYL